MCTVWARTLCRLFHSLKWNKSHSCTFSSFLLGYNDDFNWSFVLQIEELLVGILQQIRLTHTQNRLNAMFPDKRRHNHKYFANIKHNNPISKLLRARKSTIMSKSCDNLYVLWSQMTYLFHFNYHDRAMISYLKCHPQKNKRPRDVQVVTAALIGHSKPLLSSHHVTNLTTAELWRLSFDTSTTPVSCFVFLNPAG